MYVYVCIQLRCSISGGRQGGWGKGREGGREGKREREGWREREGRRRTKREKGGI